MPPEELASHQEISDLKMQIAALGVKLDALSMSINNVNVQLAKADGANLPAKVSELEKEMQDLKTARDSRAWMEPALTNVQTEVTNLNYFKYKVVGVLIVVQIVATVAGKFILDHIFPAVHQIQQIAPQ